MNNVNERNPHTRKVVALMALAENANKEFSEALLHLWLKLLDKYTPEEVEAGTLRILETYPFRQLPPFAALREAIDDTSGKGMQSIRLQASAEWAKLLSDIEKYGTYSRPPNMDTTTAHVLRLMGGWESACLWEMRYLELKRKDFIELWIESHGKADVLALGATAVRGALPGNKKLDFNKFTKKLTKEER